MSYGISSRSQNGVTLYYIGLGLSSLHTGISPQAYLSSERHPVAVVTVFALASWMAFVAFKLDPLVSPVAYL